VSLNDILSGQREALGLAPVNAKPQVSEATLRLVGDTGATSYGRKALLEEVERVRQAVEGERNETLFKAACNLLELVNGGQLADHEVREMLEAAGQHVGLDSGEIAQCVRSAEKRTAEKARGPKVEQIDGLRVDPLTGEVLSESTPGAIEDNGAALVAAVTPPDAPERTSWWPRDIAGLIAGNDNEGEVPPAFLERNDGHHLFYRGKVNALIGESESGKSWIGLLAVVQALLAGDAVLILDFEDTASGVVGRLRDMGCTADQLARLAYVSPDETLGFAQQRDLAEVLNEHRPALILFDGVNAAMTMLGLNLTDNMDATKFSMLVLRPLKRTGACVVTIDHVTKSKEGRGSYAIGAQAKRADIDGCALLVEVVRPFGKGMVGKLRLTVSKDRPGEVRAISSGGKNAGTVALHSSTNGSVNAFIEAPDLRLKDEKPAWRPTILMQRVSEYLVEAGQEMSTNTIVRNVTGNDKKLPEAADFLVEDGYAERRITPSGTKMYASIAPYKAPPEDLPPSSA
jgi:hypothetical protein